MILRFFITFFLLLVTNVSAQRERARELGNAALIGGTPGPLDAITDVAGTTWPPMRLACRTSWLRYDDGRE